MYNITRTPEDNIGGLQAVYFTDQANIAQEPDRNGVAITGNLTLKPDTTFYKLEATLNSRSFSEREKPSDAGTIYEQTVRGFKAKDSQVLGQSFAEFKNRDLAILYKDQNGTMRYFPFAQLVKDFDTETVGGRNGYDFTIKANNLETALYYTGEVILTGTTLPPADSGNGSGGVVVINDANGNTLESISAPGTYVVPGIFVIDGGSLALGNDQFNLVNGLLDGGSL